MSFNNERVVDALNSLTVPVYLSNDLVVGAERTELQRIHAQGYAKKLSVGTVHAFLLAPDGTLLDSVHVAQAKPERLISMVETQAQRLQLTPGKTLLQPTPPHLPDVPRGGLRLQVVARYLQRRPDGTLVPVRTLSGDWSALPGEDILVFTPTEAARLLSGDPKIAENLVNRFYPPTENNDLALNRIEQLDWRPEPLPRGRLRLTGTLTLKHPFYHRDDALRAVTTFVGYVEGKQFRLVTTAGRYNNQDFGVAVTSD